MRTLAILIALGLASSAGAEAQGFLLGGRLGHASSTHHTQYDIRYDRLHGMSGGLAATLELTTWLAVQAEALHVRKGARFDGAYEMRLDYLEFPVLARLASPAAFRGLKLFMVGGMAPSVERRCHGYTTPFSIDALMLPLGFPRGTVPLDCESQRKHHGDVGQVFGGGVLLNRSPIQFTIEVRRTRGVSDISGYACCKLRNDATTIFAGVSRRMR